jgi:hypothetical protein
MFLRPLSSPKQSKPVQVVGLLGFIRKINNIATTVGLGNQLV